MRRAPCIFVAPFEELSEPALVAELAARAEARGWDGFFVWDHIAYRDRSACVADPWVTLAAVAMVTSRVIIGPMVTPLARRRPHQLARETVTLDRLSGGRLVLGVGLGSERHGRVRPGAVRRGGLAARARAAARRRALEAGRVLGRRVRAGAGVADPDLGRGALAEPPAAARAPRARTACSRSTCPAPDALADYIGRGRRRRRRRSTIRRRGPGAVGRGGRDLVPDRVRPDRRPRPRSGPRSTRSRGERGVSRGRPSRC